MDDLGVIPLAQEAEVLKVLLKQVRSLRGYETVLSDQSSGSDQRLSSMQELAASAVDWIKRYNRVTSSVLELTCLVRSVAVALLRRKYPDLRLGSLKPGPSSNKFRREFSAITFAVFKGIGGGSFPKAEQRAFVSQCYKWEISTFPALAASFGVSIEEAQKRLQPQKQKVVRPSADEESSDDDRASTPPRGGADGASASLDVAIDISESCKEARDAANAHAAGIACAPGEGFSGDGGEGCANAAASHATVTLATLRPAETSGDVHGTTPCETWVLLAVNDSASDCERGNALLDALARRERQPYPLTTATGAFRDLKNVRCVAVSNKHNVDLEGLKYGHIECNFKTTKRGFTELIEKIATEHSNIRLMMLDPYWLAENYYKDSYGLNWLSDKPMGKIPYAFKHLPTLECVIIPIGTRTLQEKNEALLMLESPAGREGLKTLEAMGVTHEFASHEWGERFHPLVVATELAVPSLRRKGWADPEIGLFSGVFRRHLHASTPFCIFYRTKNAEGLVMKLADAAPANAATATLLLPSGESSSPSSSSSSSSLTSAGPPGLSQLDPSGVTAPELPSYAVAFFKLNTRSMPQRHDFAPGPLIAQTSSSSAASSSSSSSAAVLLSVGSTRTPSYSPASSSSSPSSSASSSSSSASSSSSSSTAASPAPDTDDDLSILTYEDHIRSASCASSSLTSSSSSSADSTITRSTRSAAGARRAGDPIVGRRKSAAAGAGAFNGASSQLLSIQLGSLQGDRDSASASASGAAGIETSAHAVGVKFHSRTSRYRAVRQVWTWELRTAHGTISCQAGSMGEAEQQYLRACQLHGVDPEMMQNDGDDCDEALGKHGRSTGEDPRTQDNELTFTPASLVACEIGGHAASPSTLKRARLAGAAITVALPSSGMDTTTDEVASPSSTTVESTASFL